MCGGLVHPVAGRCKHCKADLAAARSARPQAMAALPPLARSGNASPAAPAPAVVLAPPPAPEDVVALPVHAQVTQIGSTPVAAPGAAPRIVVEHPVAVAAYNPIPDGRPILPPRPTGRMRAADDRGWFARNWPVLVIVIASIAIVLAVILMVWPKSEGVDAGVKNGGVGPAPERMETNPLPPPSTDPWQNGQPPGANPSAPSAPSPAPAPDPDPDPDTTQIDPSDPLQDPFGGGGVMGGRLGGASSMAFTLLTNIANRLCAKAKTCGDPTIASMCATFDAVPTPPLPASCPQAKRCMDMIDQVDVCGGGMSSNLGPNFGQLMMQTTECMDALQRC